MTDTDVLSHLKTGDLVVAALGDRNVTVIHAENLALLLGDANLAHGAVAPGSLVATKSNTGNLGAIVFAGESGEGAPATANIQQSLILLELNLLADNGHLVVLELLERLLRVDVRDDTRGVDHARAEEPAVEVITTVIVVSNLLLICVAGKVMLAHVYLFVCLVICARVSLTLGTSVHDELGNHAQQEVLDQADGEAEASPVVTVLEDLEAVALEVDVTVKVHLVEGLHGDLVGAMVLETVGLLLELEVVLNGTAGVLGLCGLAGGDGGDNKPPAGQDGKIKEDSEEDEGLEATANLPLQPEGNAKQDGEQDLVVERVGARSISWEGSILDGGVLDGWTINQLTGS